MERMYAEFVAGILDSVSSIEESLRYQNTLQNNRNMSRILMTLSASALSSWGIAQIPGLGSRKWHDSFDFIFPIFLPGITTLERLIGPARSESRRLSSWNLVGG